METRYGLIPAPAQLEAAAGEFVLSGDVTVVACSEAYQAALHLRRLLDEGTQVGGKLVAASALAPNTNPPVIRMELETNKAPERNAAAAEAYTLNVSRSGVTIRASGAGFFWAVQTFTQLLSRAIEARPESQVEALFIPCLRITDAPRFGWRGFHLDVSRHFFSIDEIKRVIDLLALYKLNRFHWHLTDDQGWRIEIRRYPELTKKGAWRIEKDGTRSGGFYTQEEAGRIVEYAASRNIMIVPEIEMPGHASAALAAFPELSCRKQPITVWTKGGISEDVFCAGSEETFEFVCNVLDEVAELFPSPLIHIGGDECPKQRWRECPDCRKRMREERLKDEDELQSYFIRRVERHLQTRGKQIIGWDEILEGGLAPNAVVMSWRGIDGGIAAARAGHDVVMSPTSHCYFDYRQSANPGELGPTHFSPPVTTVQKVYSFEPVPDVLSPQEVLHILGAQANLWTEDVDTLSRLKYMIMPRLQALAEVLWSPRATRDWESFKERMRIDARLLDRIGASYCHILESL